MKYLRHSVATMFAACFTLPCFLHAQTPATPNSDEPVIELPSFEIQTTRDTSYTSKKAISTTRTGVDLVDLAQSVQVLNRNFIDEANSSMLGDMLKYVGGAQTGNLNFSVDRFMMRGFTGEGDYQDGFRASQSESQADMAPVERVEIIKGPSAIFIANGPVGGVVNKISKAPTDFNVLALKVQAGRFDANRVELDVGGPITTDKKLMYRAVVAGQYSEGWYDRTFVHRFLFAPSLAYAFSPDTKLTLRYHFAKTNFSSYNGLGLDMRTDNLQPGLARQVNVVDVPSTTQFGEAAPLNWRRDEVSRISAEFTTRASDLLAVRLALLWSDTYADRVESILPVIPANYTAGSTVNRSTTAVYNHLPRRTIQNDYVFTFDTGPVAHKLLTGFEFTDNTTMNKTYAGSSSALNPFNPTFPGTVTVSTVPSSKTRTMQQFGKLFALETATFAKGRVILDFGASRNVARIQTNNLIANTGTPLLDIFKTLYQYGAVVKVMPDVSVFYGYNENFAPNVQNSQVLTSQAGKQNEIGVKTSFLNKRLGINLAYFDIKQVNLTAPAFPQTTPPSFILISGENSKGIDGDISWEITKQIDVLGSFAFFNAEVPNTPTAIASGNPTILPVGNVSEKTFGFWGHYKFLGSLKGLSAGGGINYQSKKAITDSANTTFYGWVDGRTLIDLSFSYEHAKIKYSLNVDNLFNTKYIYAARNQGLIIPAPGTNIKAAVTYKF